MRLFIALAARLVKVLRKYIIAVTASFTLLLMAGLAFAALVSPSRRSLDEIAGTIGSFAFLALICLTSTIYYELRITRRALSTRSPDRDPFVFVMKQVEHILDSRAAIDNYYSGIYSTGVSSVSISDVTDAYLDDVLYRTKMIFDRLTSDQCSVCIKLFSRDPDGAFPETPQLTKIIRDQSSSAERLTERAQIIPVTDNTAFARIMGGRTARRFYFNNDLYRSYMAGDYVNSRPHWFKYYNATAVCAIASPSREDSDDILGFLCVDNFRGGFESEMTCAVLKSVSSCLYYVFSHLDVVPFMSGRVEARGGEL